MDIPRHRRRAVQRNALTLYKGALKKTKKSEEDSGVPTAGTDELLAIVEILLEENVDMAAVSRDALLEGTPMGDQMTRDAYRDADGTDLTADALDDWLRRAAHCHVPYAVITKWPLSERQLIAAWLRAVESNTKEAQQADTTLTYDMALDLPSAVSIAPSSISPDWFRQAVPVEGLTDEGITKVLAAIGCHVPPEVVAEWDVQTRTDVFHYATDMRANRPASRPHVVDVSWFSEELRNAIAAGEALAAEERAAGDASPTESVELSAEEEDEPLDPAMVDGWLIAGPWNVRSMDDEDAHDDAPPSEDFEVFWDRDVPEGEQTPLHAFVYDYEEARQVAAKMNRAAKRQVDEAEELKNTPALDDDSASEAPALPALEPIADPADAAPAEPEATDDISKQKRRRKADKA